MGSLSVRLPFDDYACEENRLKRHAKVSTAEIEWAARRLRYLFEEKPSRSLALFVPELAEQHALVERTLQAVFFPSLATKIEGGRTAASRKSSAGVLRRTFG